MARELKRNSLKNGFYIEVCSMGSRQGIKIASETLQEMLKQQDAYKANKYVIVWGEHKDGKWLHEKKMPAEPTIPKAPKLKKALI